MSSSCLGQIRARGGFFYLLKANRRTSNYEPQNVEGQSNLGQRRNPWNRSSLLRWTFLSWIFCGSFFAVASGNSATGPASSAAQLWWVNSSPTYCRRRPPPGSLTAGAGLTSNVIVSEATLGTSPDSIFPRTHICSIPRMWYTQRNETTRVY